MANKSAASSPAPKVKPEFKLPSEAQIDMATRLIYSVCPEATAFDAHIVMAALTIALNIDRIAGNE